MVLILILILSQSSLSPNLSRLTGDASHTPNPCLLDSLRLSTFYASPCSSESTVMPNIVGLYFSPSAVSTCGGRSMNSPLISRSSDMRLHRSWDVHFSRVLFPSQLMPQSQRKQSRLGFFGRYLMSHIRTLHLIPLGCWVNFMLCHFTSIKFLFSIIFQFTFLL